jgi:hypothetical protein
MGAIIDVGSSDDTTLTKFRANCVQDVVYGECACKVAFRCSAKFGRVSGVGRAVEPQEGFDNCERVADGGRGARCYPERSEDCKVPRTTDASANVKYFAYK